jgi:hypothetical protein
MYFCCWSEFNRFLIVAHFYAFPRCGAGLRVPVNTQSMVYIQIRGDQEGLFKLVTLDRILNRITEVTSGC